MPVFVLCFLANAGLFMLSCHWVVLFFRQASQPCCALLAKLRQTDVHYEYTYTCLQHGGITRITDLPPGRVIHCATPKVHKPVAVPDNEQDGTNTPFRWNAQLIGDKKMDSQLSEFAIHDCQRRWYIHIGTVAVLTFTVCHRLYTTSAISISWKMSWQAFAIIDRYQMSYLVFVFGCCALNRDQPSAKLHG